jgi:hypothetical protein
MTTPLPSLPDFLAGFGPQQSDLQSLWVNAAAFFQQRVVFRASQTGTITNLPNSGAFATIAYDTILEDPYSGWSSGAHNWTPPAGYSGWYQVTATVFVQAPGVAGVGLKLQTLAASTGSGTLVTVIVPSATVGAAEATWYVYLTGGQDAVSVQAGVQNAGTIIGGVNTNDTPSGQLSTMELSWISA